MAKINIEFDTESKEAVVSVDGQAVDNFCYASVYGKMDDMDGMCHIESRTKMGGMTKVETVYASDKKSGLSDRLNRMFRGK